MRSAFLRDKSVLVDLFQDVARVELDFLVRSGLGFGFLFGLAQMGVWLFYPVELLLPAAGAVVGARPRPFFSKSKSDLHIIAEFLRKNVLTPRRLLEELVDGENAPKLRALLRRELPFVVPDAIIDAAIGAIRDVAADEDHAVHGYVASALDVERDLSTKLKALPAAEFENLLHPVFQEDEFTLILVGGVLGAGCGMGQLALGAAAVAL